MLRRHIVRAQKLRPRRIHGESPKPKMQRTETSLLVEVILV